MREVGAFDAKNRLGALLDLVEAGEEIVITRHGRPVARLVSEVDRGDRRRARAAAERILQASQGVKLGGVKIRDLIDEGRM